jgi:AcrR family transcriptional regulator
MFTHSLFMIMKQKISHTQAKKDNTRRIILDSAYSMFAKNGYSKTTMRSLAGHAGVGLGTIFKHFPDKPSLLVAAFQEDLSKIIQDAFITLPATGLKKQLIHLTKSIYTFYAVNQRFSQTLIKEVLFLEGEYGKALNSQIDRFLNEISLLIKAAAENGEILKDINIHDGALAFWSFYFTALLMGLKQSPFDMDSQLELIGTLVDNYFFRR